MRTPRIHSDPGQEGNQSTVRVRVVQGAIAGVLARLWTMLGWFILTPWILRELGPEGFGLWSLLFLLTSYFASTDLGLSAAIARLVAEDHSRGAAREFKRDFQCALGVYPALALIWLLLVYGWGDSWLVFLRVPSAMATEGKWILRLSPLLLLVVGAQGLAAGVLSGIQRTDLVNRNLVIASIPTLGGVVVSLWFHLGLLGLFAASGAGILTGLALHWKAASSRVGGLPVFPRLPRIDFVRSAGVFGGQIQLIALAALFHAQVDKVLLAHFHGLSSVPDFELGFRLSSTAGSLPMLMLPAIMPAAAWLTGQGRVAERRQLYLEGTRILCVVALPVAGIIFAVGPALISLWVGSGHEGAVLAARWTMGAFAVSILTGIGTSIARGSGMVGREATSAVASQIFHLAAGVWLVGKWGLQGVLWGQFGGAALASLLFLALIGKPLKTPLGHLVRVSLAAPALAGLVGWGAAATILVLARAHGSRPAQLLDLGVAGLVASLISLAVAFVAGGLRRSDLRLVRAAIAPGPLNGP